MEDETFLLWVGIDWGNEAHRVCIIDGKRRIVDEFFVAHTGKAIGEFAARLLEIAEGDPSRLAVSIETPRGSIIETLIERGVAIFSINPKQLDRFRDRHTVAGAKDDRRDAFVLADSLRTDMPSFRRVRLGDPRVVEIRELVRIHEDLSGERVALGNRLGAQLNRYFPQILALGSVHDEAWLWALLERAISPAQAAQLSLAEIQSILKAHAIRRLSAEHVRETLRQQPLHVAPGVVEAATNHIEKLLPRLRLAHDQQKQCLREIEALLDQLGTPDQDAPAGKTEHRDAAILRSLPGVGTLVSATMLAEAWQPLVDRDYRTLRAQCGIAPVTRQSGKKLTVSMRYACNGRLRNAMHHATMNCVNRDALAKAHYARLRAKGHSHGRAIRGVADRLLRILVVMLREGAPYDPTKRRAYDAKGGVAA